MKDHRPDSPRFTTALVLETNNLRGGEASAERVTSSMVRLVEHLRAQTVPLSVLDEVVVTHDGLGGAERARISDAAGIPIRFVDLPPGAGYYTAKNLGFDATSADVVVFGDADCWPDPSWLERLLAPFHARERGGSAAQVVAGRTAYRDDVLGIAATSIDFMYFASPLASTSIFADEATRNFYANNVAFRREVFAAHRYQPAAGTYRGHCQRLGLALTEAGVPIQFVPEALTVHRFPDSVGELLRLRMLRGADTVEMTPHFTSALLPRRWHWLGRLGPLSPMLVLATRLGLSARAVGRQGPTPVRGLQRAACMATMTAISSADAVGALARSTLKLDLGVRDGALTRRKLSYHGDVDRLS